MKSPPLGGLKPPGGWEVGGCGHCEGPESPTEAVLTLAWGSAVQAGPEMLLDHMKEQAFIRLSDTKLPMAGPHLTYNFHITASSST